MSRENAPLPLLELGSRAELRAWLEANHATCPGVRLAVGKKGTTATSLTYDDAVEEGLAFGWIDSKAQRLDADRYTITFTPRRRGGTWARSNKARVDRLLSEGLMTPAGTAAVEAAKADGSWEVLDDVDNLVVPDDLAEKLAASGADSAFSAQPASQRQMSLYWIGSAKRPQTRENRIASVVSAAIEGRRLW